MKFPLHVYPKNIQEFCKRATKNTGSPENYIPAGVLSVIGACLGAKTKLIVGTGYEERPCVWVALVGGSGTGKNPAVSTVCKPLWDYDRAVFEQSKAEYAFWKQQDAEYRRDNPKPDIKHVTVSSPTIESVRKILSQNAEGLLLAHGELSGWINSMGEYKGGKGSDRQTWLEIYSGAPIKATRASEEISEAVYNPFVCILGGVQPKLLSVLLGGDGLHARVLYVPGEQTEITGLPSPVGSGQDFNYPDWQTTVTNLCDRRETETILHLDEHAYKMADEYIKELRQRVILATDDYQKEVLAKTGTVFRLAIILWALSGQQGMMINSKLMADAIELNEWFLSEAEEALGKLDLSNARQREEHEQLQQLRKWLLNKEAEGVTLTLRYICQYGPAWVRKRDTAMKALESLGYVIGPSGGLIEFQR